MSAGTENTPHKYPKVSRFVSCNSRLKLDHTVQSGCDYSRERKGKMAKEFQKKQFPLPMWRMCCPTVLPFTSDVTLRLLSQWPPLKSNFPSWDTTNRWAVTSTTGENGPARNLWVLERERESGRERERGRGRERERERARDDWLFSRKCRAVTVQTGREDVNRQRDSLYTGYGGVFDEGEIVGYVLVVGQPAVSSHQAVLAQSYLDNPKTHYLHLHLCI